jgi:hypothetical protein
LKGDGSGFLASLYSKQCPESTISDRDKQVGLFDAPDHAEHATGNRLKKEKFLALVESILYTRQHNILLTRRYNLYDASID